MKPTARTSGGLPPLALACCAAAIANLAAPAAAQTAPATSRTAPATLDSVIVRSTRIDTSPFEAAASVDVVDGARARDGKLQVNLSESLGGVPGLTLRDRQNYAQDQQLSIRGFGARSAFGVRGVRIYVDGIPATLPDGQGQLSNIDLGALDRIEVLRGPFSALYGNSAGGVIQAFTAEGKGAPTLEGGYAFGSFGTQRESLRFSGETGGLGYSFSGSHFETGGYREHSVTQRDLGNVKLTTRPDEWSKLTIVANYVNLKAQDPLGLTRANFERDPRGVESVALSFDTRKTVQQTQGGLQYERQINAANSLAFSVYDGHRDTVQYQAIPTGPQNAATHPGGVIGLGREYYGVDARWNWKGELAGRPLKLVGGVAADALDENRKGYQNFIGGTTGVMGALRRDENNKSWNIDQYVQAEWRFATDWKLDAGVRHSRIGVKSIDRYIVPGNPDDSGSTDYTATLPVVGLQYAATPDLRLYATAGRGFETPTLNELAYRANGLTGMNFGLQPSRSDNLEVGAKWRHGPGLLTLAAFRTSNDNEIVTLTNTGGRATYQNAGSTRRQGVELSWSAEYEHDIRTQIAYTLVDATYRETFATCTGTPCATPNTTIPAGRHIPGVARQQGFAELAWAPATGPRASIEGRVVDRVYVNDANSDAAGGYGTVGLGAGWLVKQAGWSITGFGRVDNVFDRKYAGSVIVNEGNSRFFEPAPGRNWIAGVTGAVSF
ncbi:TonB-dependent receptor family protein [Derxia gummosa]|uniref:TonB-dependent receptor family protein n=1 Tax=Derxia gummosa DSM 723 TaxID=1121388 RepID=A0A8B6XBG2_9BURK|nr:TonB-dependent receptor [Derxia gummosa]